MRFCLKFVDSLAFALPSLLLMLRLARPDAKPRALALWLVAPFILLAAGVVVELFDRAAKRVDVPAHGRERDALHDHDSDAGGARPGGAHRRAARRRAASPGSDWGAGRRGAAAGIAALFYASSCPDNSPLFVATWYPLATLICIGVGALAGRRFLAW